MFHFRQELLSAISELEIRTSKNVAALLVGNYRSPYRGSGMQFKEFRHYEEGDDIRHVSWMVTARTGKTTLKLYEEEREINVCLLVDTSGSSLLQHNKIRRVDMYAELVALLGLAAVRSGDNAGVLFFNSEPGLYLSPKRSKDQVMHALHHLLEVPLSGKGSSLAPALQTTTRLLKGRSLVIVLSDFIVPSFEKELAELAHRHEVVLMHCYDDLERGLGPNQIFEVEDPETGTFFILDGKSRRNKKILAESQHKRTNELRELCDRTQCDYLPLSIQDDYLRRLIHFFRGRGPARA